MFKLVNKLIRIYKTFDIMKTVIFDPNVYDVLGNRQKIDTKIIRIKKLKTKKLRKMKKIII